MDAAKKEAFAKLTLAVEGQSDALAALTDTVERGFAAVADDVAKLDGRIGGLETEMREGFAAIREELRDIEQHLGIELKIVA